MKLLKFPIASNGVDLFELAYIGMMAPDVRLVPAEIRAHGKLLDKFEEHGAKHEEKGRVLKEGETAEIIVEDAELAVLKKCCEGFPWNKAKSRAITRLYDLLEATEKSPEYRPAAPEPSPTT